MASCPLVDVIGQDPSGFAHGLGPQALPQQVDTSFLAQLQEIGWVDRTAFAVLLVFFVIGLFKGLIWQVSRVGILLVAYVLSTRYGRVLGDWLAQTSEPALGPRPTSAQGAGVGAAQPWPLPQALPTETPETTLYLAYVLLFLAVLVVLSLTAILLQKLARKAGLGFFDRVGGGVVGFATGACLVLFGLAVVHMFFRGSRLAIAAEHSHCLRLSQQAIGYLGTSVPDELRAIFALQPLQAPEPGSGQGDEPLPGQPPGQSPGQTPGQNGNAALPGQRQGN